MTQARTGEGLGASRKMGPHVREGLHFPHLHTRPGSAESPDGQLFLNKDFYQEHHNVTRQSYGV